MKKLYILFTTLFVLTLPTHAQFTDWGVRFGLGPTTISDELLTKTPIVGFDLGGYVNYGFEEIASAWSDNLFLQFGFNVTRRGANFEQELVASRSYREGFYHLYYAEIPITIGWKMELPITQPDHYVSIFAGPAISVGLFGKLWDRQVTPGYPQNTVNFDTYWSSNKDDHRAFQHMRRLDISSRIGIGYKHQNYTVHLIWDHGFIPLMRKGDVLRDLAIQNNGGSTTYTDSQGNTVTLDERNSYTGRSNALILSVGYTLPMK